MQTTSNANVRTWRETIYSHMLQTRGAKYRWFLRHLKLFRWITPQPARAEFLETYYTLMRYIDDIVDGDAPLPKGYESEEQYLLDKIEFARNPILPADDVDALMKYCFELGASFGESFVAETEDILGSLLFDCRRMGEMLIFPECELMAHYHRLDISGTVRATLKLFNEDPDKYLLLEPLGMASRFYYDIRDFREDIEKGLVNITAEDMAALGISKAALSDANSMEIRRWFRTQAIRGMAMLEQHEWNVQQSGFRRWTHWTFPVVYGWPARKFFKKVLIETMDTGDFTIPPFMLNDARREAIQAQTL